jgi:hypothetical protein
MKIALIILAVISVGIVGILAFAASKPDVFTVQRTASIKAPPEKIFPFINDFRQWTIWSPFEKMDPMKRSYGAITAQGRDLCMGRQQEDRRGQHGDS